jgi:Lrp/AsnC family transcriptional regulator
MEERPGMTPDLDALDLRILDALQRDATTPVADLAARVDASKTVVWRRVQRLVKTGVIRERVALLDHRKVGLGVMVIAQVKMARHNRDALRNFTRAIKPFPQVIECHLLMGNMDFLLKVLVADIEEYEHFVWQKLSQIENVREVVSSISMNQFVNTTRLPLKAAAAESRA